MSADGHTVCPKCHPDLLTWVDTKPRWDHSVPEYTITDNAAEELGYDRSVRENWEFYIKNGNILVSEYEASCWDCSFSFTIKHEDPIPGLEST